jgi:outer membrane protein assembly factor BamB
MRIKTIFLISAILALGGLLSACGNQSLASTDWPGLTVKDDMAYLAAGTYVYAINLANGQELTITQGSETTPVRFPADGRGGPFYGDPAFTSDGQMIIGSANINDRKHPLFSANAADFTTKWTFEDQAKDIWLAGALILNDVIYMPNSDGGLYAFDLNGNIKGLFMAEHALWSNPVTDGQSIYVASMDHNVYAVDPGNLNQIWKTELDASITASPTIKDGRLYIGTIDGAVYALDAETGSILWQKDFEGGISDQVVAHEDRLYFGLLLLDTGTIFALNAEDGTVIWSYDAGGAVTAHPLVTDELVVFVTETGTVRALDHDAKPLWMQTIDAKLYSPAAAAGDLILVAPMGKQDMMLMAYDTAGALKWIFAPVKK